MLNCWKIDIKKFGIKKSKSYGNFFFGKRPFKNNYSAAVAAAFVKCIIMRNAQ